ncbi:MAG: NAD(P)H-binding protein [Thermoplasmata archaeon]|nr:NAD(P)H-binding protein [Thermoplasmata archaeon]
MSPSVGPRPRVLLVGGAGGLIGRHLLEEFGRDHRIRSLHRTRVPSELAQGVEWVPADIATYREWSSALGGVDLVVNLAWYRAGPRRRFVGLCDGLIRMLAASVEAGVPRVVQISVPKAPARLEAHLPYLTEKRRFDAELLRSGLSVRILRPTMLFGPGDVLIDAMLRSMRRYPVFPMFGDGRYHVSPLAVSDLARIVRLEAASGRNGSLDVGGPRRYEYRELTDLLFRAARRRPRYWRMSGASGVRLARLLETFGSRLLYAYEVEWLIQDMLGLAPYEGLAGGLRNLEAYLDGRGPLSAGPRADPPVRP